MSLCKLDLGIETCFLISGMTEYNKVWLRFIFPIYLLIVIGVLVYSSRYSLTKRMEKLTRKRAIPVIVMILLLSYNKILLVISSVLFSFVLVHSLNSGKTEWFWSIDTSIPLFGVKLYVLFVVCLLIFLLIIASSNKFLFDLHKILIQVQIRGYSHLKPFFDFYQAPRYLVGIGLFLCAVAMAADFLII